MTDEHPLVREARHEYDAALVAQQLHASEDSRRVKRAKRDLDEATAALDGRDPTALTADHMTLLRAAYWDYNYGGYGAATINPKRPYGNSDVDRDLKRLLPHLDPVQRYRVHRELPAVLPRVLALVEASFEQVP